MSVQFLPHGGMRYLYQLRGAIDELDLPGAKPPQRTDDLWRQTCLEAFLRTPGASAYDEFNFAPSGEWAAYRFEHYRSGRVELEVAAIPAIVCHRGAHELGIEVITGTPETLSRQLQIGLSAVLRERSGAVSYWALQHAAGKPDFHHADAFAGRLSVP